jgi:transcriptional regulator with XRE-family HTH domain
MSIKLGTTIKQLREAKRLSREEFAKKIKRTENYIYLLESDKRQPRVSGLESIAKVLGLSIAEIFTEAEKESKK